MILELKSKKLSAWGPTALLVAWLGAACASPSFVDGLDSGLDAGPPLAREMRGNGSTPAAHTHGRSGFP